MRISFVLLLFLIISHPLPAQSTVLQVVTESSPPYHYLNKYGRVDGETTHKVKAILEAAGVKGEFALYPWARSITMAERQAGTLIYSIARTPEREKQFHWLAEVSAFHLAVVGLKSQPVANGELKQGYLTNYTFAVQRDDISYHWLQQQGFREGQNMLVCADIQCSWDYLLRGMVDFIIEDPALIPATAKKLNVDGEQLNPVMDIPELAVTGYLAASKGTDPAVVSQLKEAAQQLGMGITSGDGRVAPQ